MNKLMIAVAWTIALPSAAFAQAAPTAAPSAHAGHDMQKMNCKDMPAARADGHGGHQMSGASGQMDHSKMDHSKMDHAKMDHSKMCQQSAPKPAADTHQNHQH